MYIDFFHLKEDPFGETPNTKFYYFSQCHLEALNKLAHHLDNGNGFITITGEVGTGKTMLTRFLIKKCDLEISTAYIYWPALKPNELISTICAEFGLPEEKRNIKDLENFLLNNAKNNKKSVLFIDEAQWAPFESLELIRVISNLESETSKLIQIVLIGQTELDTKLKLVEYRQLSQRVSLRIKLDPLNYFEMESYIKHIIEVAKGSNFVKFEKSALRQIFNLSQGTPRLVNLICKTALIFSAKNEIRIINEKIIFESLAEQNLIKKYKKHFYFKLFKPKLEIISRI